MSKGTTRAVAYFGAAIFLISAVIAATAGTVLAQEHTCAFVNDNYFDAPNTVDGYVVTGTTATYLSPVLTGGTSQGDAGYREEVTEIAVHPTMNILYVSDDESDDIAAMKIDPQTCLLKLLGNYPVTGGDGHGIGLAISPNGAWLYAANTNSLTLNVLDVHPDGSLTYSKQNTKLMARPAGMAVSPDGTTLVISFPGTRHGTFQVMSYAIDSSDGTLTPVSTVNIGNSPQGIAIDAQSKFVYVGTYNFDAVTIEQMEIGPGSTLTSVFHKAWHVGFDSSSVMLNSDGKYLYASNALSDSITTFTVAPVTGTLKLVTVTQDGPSGILPGGLATAANGKFLFSGSNGPFVGGLLGIFSAGKNGSLVSLGTFYVGQGASKYLYPTSVVARSF